MDTRSAYSILTCTSSAQPTGPALTTASGASVKSWGRKRMQLSSGGQIFSWRLLKADVAFPIIGADFLANFNMVVDLSDIQLLAPKGLKISWRCQVLAASHSSLYTLASHSGGTFLFSYTSHRGGTWRQHPRRGGRAPRRAWKCSLAAKEVASVALEVEQLIADYPSVVNSSKKLPKAKHQVKHLIEKCAHTR